MVKLPYFRIFRVQLRVLPWFDHEYEAYQLGYGAPQNYGEVSILLELMNCTSK